jgi:FSR family fosmidomycin resistance protein-like MFS transporter
MQLPALLNPLIGVWMDRVSLPRFVIQEKTISSPAAANGFLMTMSFMARSSVVVVVGFLGDVIGLEATYICRVAVGLAAIPFIVMVPPS